MIGRPGFDETVGQVEHQVLELPVADAFHPRERDVAGRHPIVERRLDLVIQGDHLGAVPPHRRHQGLALGAEFGDPLTEFRGAQ
jgi:hypothetical protein